MTAEALGDPDSAVVLLRRAEETTRWFDYSVLDRACGMAQVAGAYSARGRPEDAERLHTQVLELARGQGAGFEGFPIPVPETAAYALRETRPDEAKALALLAAEGLDGDGRPIAEVRAHSAVLALVTMDRMAEAQRIAQTMDDTARRIGQGFPSDTWWLVVEGWARRGAVAEAWAALGAWRNSTPPFLTRDHGSAARVVDLLTAAGAATQVEALLLHQADAARVSVPWQDLVEGLATLAGHLADDDPQTPLAIRSQPRTVSTR